MIHIKRFLLAILLLFPIALIFNHPGLPILETYYKHPLNYPPLIDLLFKNILSLFPPQKSIYFFYNQSAWALYKFILFFTYYITFFSITHLAKSISKKQRFEKIDLALFYFGSVSILLLSVALSFYDILAAPFLILSISFLFRKKYNTSALLFITTLCFNFNLAILGPLFFLYIFINKRPTLKLKILPFLSFVGLPIILFISNILYLSPQVISHRISTNIFSFPWLFDHPSIYILNHNTIGSISADIGIATIITISLASIVVLIYLIKKLGIFKLLIATSLIIAILSKMNPVFIFFICLFLSCYWKLVSNYKKHKTISKSVFINSLFISYLLYTLSFPSIPNGNLIWISVLALLVLIFQKSTYSKILLLTVNLIVFTNMFVFYGSAGRIPVRGDYFLIFQSIFAMIEKSLK